MRPDHYASRNPYCHSPQYGRRVVRATGRAGFATVKVGFRHRNKLAPLFVAAGLAIASTVLHIVDAVTGWQTALVIAVLLSLLLGGKQWFARRRGEPWPTSSLVQSWLALTSAAGWTAVAASMAPWSVPMPGLLAAGYLVSQAAWLWHHRERPEVVMEPVEEEPQEYDARVFPWVTAVAAEGGPLPGAELHSVKDLPNKMGWHALIQLRPGKQSTSTAVSAVESVASAYELPLQSVVIEPTADNVASRASLQVYERNPLQEKKLWPGPSLSPKGVIPLSIHPDGGDALYRMWRPGSGAVHDLIAGATDSGKSRLVDLLLAEERHSPLIASWVIDPQRGQSLPDWQDAVDYFADSAEHGASLLLDAYRVMLDRNERLAQMQWVDDKGRKRTGKSYFEPSPEMPLLSITVEEAPNVLRIPEALAAAEAIANMGRKCGVKLRLVVQVPLLSQLGNSMALRDAVASGNVIVLRTANPLTGQVAFNGTIAVDPHRLPREWPDGSSTGGLGYMLGASSRPAMMRTRYVEDPYAWATSGERTTIEQAAVMSGAVTYWTMRDHRAMGIPFDFRSFQEQEAGAEKNAPVPPASKAAPAQDSVKTRSRIKEYLLEHGATRTGVIADALDLPKPTCSMALKRMENDNQAVRVRAGVWDAVKEMADSVA